ncbi:sensor histidine kinase [Nesterenkonia lutea]|uniref:histidine kinase n=1 Tax=Nesterenkonia lutea TaxID=272919 RepID=A0ABR9JFP3_9MICC|nr:PAS domain-containing sensor histidine kinase [Nesterenkonia lutea]MBE1524750.1 signal transduction histidine kinase [Nesterenkonia lutea]
MTRIGTLAGALLYHSSGKSFSLVQQLTFLVVLAAPVLALAIYEPETTSLAGVALGLGLLLAATVAVVFAPRQGLPRPLEWTVPVISIVACGICRVATLPDGAVLSTLSLVPSLWLVVRFRRAGAGLAVGMVILTISIPSLAVITEPLNVASFSRYTVLPVALAVMSLAVIGILQRVEASRAEMERALAGERKMGMQRERSDRLLRDVGENLNVGVLVMDAHGNDVMTNRAQREIHAVVSSEGNPDPTEAGHLIFYTDGTSIPPDSRPAARANRGEEFDNFNFLAGAPGPEQRVITVSARAVLAEDGSRDAIFLIFRDITEEHHLLRAQHEIIATVSHEMRTPLTSIVGFADFTEDALQELPVSAAREDSLEQLSVIRRNAERLSKLVEDLLLEQQAVVGRLTLDMRSLDLEELVADCVKGFHPLAVTRGISLETQLESSVPVIADSLRLAQVIDNLISNALKYTQTGGHVTVTAGTVPEGAEGVFVQVSDDGPGMSQKEASQVFTPFYRAPAARQSATAGAGLGLALSQSIIEAHGGSITVRSAPGEGSRFRFTLDHHISRRAHAAGD